MKKIFLLFITTTLFSAVSAQRTFPAEASKAEFLGKSRPLRELPELPGGKGRKEKKRRLFPREVPNFTFNRPMPTPFADVALPRGGDPLLQPGANRNPMIMVEPDTVWEGIGIETAGATPPDPVIDASPRHIIQMSNSAAGSYFRVYNKSGGILLNLPNLNNLWSEFNSIGGGDPIVLWDQAAERWLITEFANFFSGANFLLVAVSETSDPLGSWYAYRFQTPNFPDYPKYGIWHNAYIVTANEPGNNIPVYALEREAMLAGAPDVSIQRIGIPKFGSGVDFQVATPIDFDGINPPPPGSPAYVARLYDDAWEGGADKVELWEIHIDWLDAGNSYAYGPAELFSAPFEAKLCDGSLTNCIPQPNSVRLDALQDIILHRAPYLNFGSHETILLHFAVDVDGNNRAGLRWMELRRNGGPWRLHQEGSYAPDDGQNRFAGAISMDYSGNILMAYTVSSANTFPSLRFTGRLNSDPPGQMTVEEYEFGTGLSSQASNRWGDYASMSVDPANGRDFWFTGEYMKGNGSWGAKVLKAHLRRDSVDAGPNALLRPQDSGALTAAEAVQVAVRNYGLKDVSGVAINYSVDGGPFTTDTITASIPPQEAYVHTFSSTANLAAPGVHDFVIFTRLAGDTAFFNDTLRTAVFQLPRNDAAVTFITGLEGAVCDSFRLVGINLANGGADSLFSATLSCQLNEGPVVDIAWAGALPPGEKETVFITIGPLANGDNTFFALAGLPNGLPDERPGNDLQERAFTAVLEGEEVNFQLLTDSYPEETSWELKDEAGNVLYSGGPYSEAETLVIESICLFDGCYTLSLFDSFGDGLVGPPLGSFQITNGEGQFLARLEDAGFGDQINLDFCSPFQCLLELSAVVDNESAPGATDGRIILGLENGLAPFEFSIDGGNTFQSSPDFPSLPAGAYQVVVRDENECRADTTLVVGSCALMASAETAGVSGAGQADGKITILITGGIGPYLYSINGRSFQPENTFTGLGEGEYTVTVRDEGTGCETEVTVVIGIMVGAEEAGFFGRQVRLFPNPTEGYARIEIRGFSDRPFLPVQVFDDNGKVVRRSRLAAYGEYARGVVSLYGLPGGTYYLQFVDERLPGLFPVVKR